MIGLVDLLPYIGSGICFSAVDYLSSMTGQTAFTRHRPWHFVYRRAFIQRQISEPKVLSKSIGLNPLATLWRCLSG